MPISAIFISLVIPVLKVVIHIAIIGMLLQAGVGLLHGANERIASKYEETGKHMPEYLRPLLAAILLGFCAYLATEIGLIGLVAKGFRYSTYYSLIVFVLPILTIGTWKILKADQQKG